MGRCNAKGCPKVSKTKGFCRAHYMKVWRSRTKERVDDVRIPSREDVDHIWELMEDLGGIPLNVAAGHLGLKITGEIIQAIRSRAEAAGLDLEEAERSWVAMTRKIDDMLREELRAKISQGLDVENAAEELEIGNLAYARQLVGA